MNLKRQLEMQRRYAAQARGEKPVEPMRISADFIEIPDKPKRKPRKKPEGGE